MSNLSTHIRKEKPRLMNKEDKEYWRKKVADKLSSKRSDLEAVFESDIQKMKDKKWKSWNFFSRCWKLRNFKAFTNFR